MDEHYMNELESLRCQVDDLQKKSYEVDGLKEKCKNLESHMDWMFFWIVVLVISLIVCVYFTWQNYQTLSDVRETISYFKNLLDSYGF